MSTADPGMDPREAAAYVQTWADAFSQALAEIAGSAVPCSILPESAQPPTAAEGELWIIAASSGALRGEMRLRLAPAVTVRLAQLLMSEPPSEVEVTSEHHEAALELCRQVAGLAATAQKAKWGETQLHLEASSAAPSWPASSGAWLCIGQDTATRIQIQISAALAASLRVEPTAADQPGIEPAPVATAKPAASPQRHDEKVNFDLLMDVELGVTLRFGSRHLLLREVLDLTSGSVIDLDRMVQEPVDLLLDGRVLARGEIVVMGGNYGLRVTEVAPTS